MKIHPIYFLNACYRYFLFDNLLHSSVRQNMEEIICHYLF